LVNPVSQQLPATKNVDGLVLNLSFKQAIQVHLIYILTVTTLVLWSTRTLPNDSLKCFPIHSYSVAKFTDQPPEVFNSPSPPGYVASSQTWFNYYDPENKILHLPIAMKNGLRRHEGTARCVERNRPVNEFINLTNSLRRYRPTLGSQLTNSLNNTKALAERCMTVLEIHMGCYFEVMDKV
jgi:hypothetical protein